MDWKRLFHVLVVGWLGAGLEGVRGKDEDKGEARDAATLSDATAAPEDTGGDAPADAATSPPADAGLDAADDAGDAAVESVTWPPTLPPRPTNPVPPTVSAAPTPSAAWPTATA
jgi:hypothetical protein